MFFLHKGHMFLTLLSPPRKHPFTHPLWSSLAMEKRIICLGSDFMWIDAEQPLPLFSHLYKRWLVFNVFQKHHVWRCLVQRSGLGQCPSSWTTTNSNNSDAFLPELPMQAKMRRIVEKQPQQPQGMVQTGFMDMSRSTFPQNVKKPSC